MAEKAQASGKAKRTTTPLGNPKSEIPEGAETKELVGAFIVPQEWVNKFFVVIGELPRKLSPMIDPLIEELNQCHRGDINLVIQPPPEEKKDE
jgi:hypothetical protein